MHACNFRTLNFHLYRIYSFITKNNTWARCHDIRVLGWKIAINWTCDSFLITVFVERNNTSREWNSPIPLIRICVFFNRRWKWILRKKQFLQFKTSFHFISFCERTCLSFTVSDQFRFIICFRKSSKILLSSIDQFQWFIYNNL